MKRIRFLFGTLPVLILGWIGCSQDSSQQTQSLEKVSFRYQDLSYPIRGIETIDVTSFIELEFQNSVHPEAHYQVKSKCSKNSLESFSGQTQIQSIDLLPVEGISNETEIKNTDFLVVKDILPPEVFAPSSQIPTEVLCDFDIQVFNNKNQKIASILIKEIHIDNIETYSDYDLVLRELAGSTKDKPLYLHREDIEDLKITMPTEKGYGFTLCEDSKRVLSFDKEDGSMKVLPIASFFDDKLFGDKNFVSCRLVFHQEAPAKTWVSDSFLIQNKKPQITYRYKQNNGWRDYDGWQWFEQTIGVLTISNEGDNTVYLQIPNNLTTIMDILSIYSHSSNEMHYGSEITGFTVRWMIREALSEAEKSESHSIYPLDPGRSIHFSLKTENGFGCLPFVHSSVLTNNKPELFPPEQQLDSISFENMRMTMLRAIGINIIEKCNELYKFSGFLYRLHKFPEIAYNLFTDQNYEQWQTLPLETTFPIQHNEHSYQWVPDDSMRNQDEHCHGNSFQRNFDKFPRVNTAFQQWFRCDKK